MGMDLVPRYRGKVDSLHFNWGGWSKFGSFLDEVGADTSYLAGGNDGDYIPAKSCRAISSKLEEYKERFVRNYYEMGWCNNPLNPCGEMEHLEDRVNEIINFFQNCGGCRQF